MEKALLLFPEFANTFILPYIITRNIDNKFGNYIWQSILTEWNEDIKIKYDELEKMGYKAEVIAFYASSSYEKDIQYFFQDFQYEKIRLPQYFPRLFFIPYDYTIYEKIYKTRDINPKMIVTDKDISNIPYITDSTICKCLKKRGVVCIPSDTKLQANFIYDNVINTKWTYPPKSYPIRLYYFGAPLTIFYLNSYPRYLPIRVNIDIVNKEKYREVFDTYLYLLFKSSERCDNEEYGNILERVNNLKDSIKNIIFQLYAEAIIEPQLLSPMYKKYKEMVPQGHFYTMRNVEDFAKAITLHCSSSLDEIKRELEYDNDGKDIDKETNLIKEITSESSRHSEKERIDELNKIKGLALGCSVYLHYYILRNEEKRNENWEILFGSNSQLTPLFGTYLFLYKSIISCLAWQYCIRYCKHKVKGKSMRNRYHLRTHTINRRKNIYIQFKQYEKSIINQFDNSDINIEKVIAYVEYLLDSFVEEKLKKKNSDYLRLNYRIFSKIIIERNENDPMIDILFSKFSPLKVIEY